MMAGGYLVKLADGVQILTLVYPHSVRIVNRKISQKISLNIRHFCSVCVYWYLMKSDWWDYDRIKTN